MPGGGGKLALAVCDRDPAWLGSTAALFLTAWVIYLSNRFVDSVTANRAAGMSLREEFCVRQPARLAWRRRRDCDR
jgi:hypothetical protein